MVDGKEIARAIAFNRTKVECKWAKDQSEWIGYSPLIELK